MHHQIVPAISADVFGLVGDLYQAKADAVRDQGPQEFIMVAGHEYHTGTTLGMAQDASDHIGMALLPPPPVALHLPTIDDVSHQIQGFTGIVLEEVVECLGLAVSGAEVYI